MSGLSGTYSIWVVIPPHFPSLPAFLLLLLPALLPKLPSELEAFLGKDGYTLVLRKHIGDTLRTK